MRIQDRGAAGLQARLQNVDGFVYILHAVDQISSAIAWNDLVCEKFLRGLAMKPEIWERAHREMCVLEWP
jgi:hypothetical protein